MNVYMGLLFPRGFSSAGHCEMYAGRRLRRRSSVAVELIKERHGDVIAATLRRRSANCFAQRRERMEASHRGSCPSPRPARHRLEMTGKKHQPGHNME